MVTYTHLYDMRGVLIDFPDDKEIINRGADGIWDRYARSKKEVVAGTMTKQESLQIKDRLMQIYIQFVKEGTIRSEPVSGIEALLKVDKKAGIRTALFTSDEELLDIALQKSGLESYVDDKYTCAEYGRKEDAESHERVLQAIKAQGQTPTRYIEDSIEKFIPHIKAAARALSREELAHYKPIFFDRSASGPYKVEYTTIDGDTIAYYVVSDLSQVQEIEAGNEPKKVVQEKEAQEKGVQEKEAQEGSADAEAGIAKADQEA